MERQDVGQAVVYEAHIAEKEGANEQAPEQKKARHPVAPETGAQG